MWVIYLASTVIVTIFAIGVAIIVWLLIRAIISHLKRKK